MSERRRCLCWGVVVLLVLCGFVFGDGVQYVVLNRMPGVAWNQGLRDSVDEKDFVEVTEHFGEGRSGGVQIGLACIISYLRTDRDLTVGFLKGFLKCAEATDTPIVLKFEGENWWQGRPDLWNWWDPSKPGYDPANRENVEWTGWSSDDAIKISWRNWGMQFRLLPAPNLMSQRYRAACKAEMDVLLPIVMDWWKKLPADKKDLLIGINVGHESSIGVNAWYYPNGNSLLGKDAKNDPQDGLDGEDVLARGQVQIGYAAVKTAGIRSEGEITEQDLYEVVRRHLESLSKQVARHGFPREMIFTHGAGWKDEELMYDAAVNEYSCPGWSFYKHSADPAGDGGVQRGLKKSTAPYWAAAEWLLMREANTKVWREAIENTLADRKCRFVCIYNWEGIREKEPVLQAICEMVNSKSEYRNTKQIKSSN